jgi:NADH:ubiquinone oxidoreductase subunit K
MFEIDMIFAFALFSIGLYGVSSNRDFLRIFFSLEMLINAVILMLASSAHYLGLSQNISLAYMVMILATLEAAVGILIFAAANKFTQEIVPDNYTEEGSS